MVLVHTAVPLDVFGIKHP